MSNVVMDACVSQIGKPYVFDTPLDRNNPNPVSFDCSGLTMWAYAKAGIVLPHNAASQWALMKHRPVDQAQGGDVMFWQEGGTISHCAIYMGDGTIIEAPEPGKFVQRKPFAYWKPPLSTVGVYSGAGETGSESGVNIANIAALSGQGTATGNTLDASSSSGISLFNDHGFFSWISTASNWARIGLGLLGGIILVFIVYHYVGNVT